jgi:hypothetical protein
MALVTDPSHILALSIAVFIRACVQNRSVFFFVYMPFGHFIISYIIQSYT